LRTASGAIEILHPAIDAELARLGERLDAPPAGDDALRLVGRREFKSNNSWMHNLPSLIGTEDACVLLMHPADAARRGLAGGTRVRLRGAAGSIDVPMDLDDSLAPGVVSLPHGYGHGREGVRLAAAQRFPGASYNDVVAGEIDLPSGNAVLNGVAVEVSAA
jgi:anaerobic selenocysteine-containing dehydrogenase